MRLLCGVLLLTGCAWGQLVVPRVVEAPVEGIARADAETVTVALPGSEALGMAKSTLALHGFEFEGAAVQTSKLHFKQISPGVVEITSVAYSVGQWRFRVKDAGSYYGLGERFDVLNHAHTVVLNASQDNAKGKGAGTYKPMPFFMSTSGYGMWVDTTAEAVFDMNASNGADVVVDVPTDKLRVVVFTAAEFPKML